MDTTGDDNNPAPRENGGDSLLAEIEALSREWAQRDDGSLSTILSLQDALAQLGRMCDAAAGALAENQTKRAADASRLARLVGAVEQERAEARDALTRALDENRRLDTDLRAEQDRAARIADDLETAENARAQADVTHASVLDALQSQVDSTRVELEAARVEVARLKEQVQEERTARHRLIDALQTVQRVVSGTEPLAPAAPAQSDLASADNRPEPTTRPGSGEEPVAPSLKLISRNPDAGTEADRELAAYAKHLLEQIHSIYSEDVNSGFDLTVVVDRLTANLRHAHAVFERRSESCGGLGSNRFEMQLAVAMAEHAESAFGHHLAIAAYSCAPSHRAEAS